MTTRVFAVANQKGGSGKTTLSMNFAAGLSKKGRTLIIDADPQGSASQWSSLASEHSPFPVSVIAIAGNLTHEVNRFSQDYEYIVIDCPPTLETEHTRKAMLSAHNVLIPVLPSPVDLWASIRLADTIEQIKQIRPELKANLVINQLEPRSALSRAMHEALAEFDIPALNSYLRRRAIYRNVAIEGRSIYCAGKQARAAVNELDEIIEELLS
jgi:chromosome partitioning protein